MDISRPRRARGDRARCAHLHGRLIGEALRPGGDGALIPVRQLRPSAPPQNGGRARRLKQSGEAVFRLVAIGVVGVVLVVNAVAAQDWGRVLDALPGIAAVVGVLGPLFWLMNSPKPRPRLRAVPDLQVESRAVERLHRVRPRTDD